MNDELQMVNRCARDSLLASLQHFTPHNAGENGGDDAGEKSLKHGWEGRRGPRECLHGHACKEKNIRDYDPRNRVTKTQVPDWLRCVSGSKKAIELQDMLNREHYAVTRSRAHQPCQRC